MCTSRRRPVSFAYLAVSLLDEFCARNNSAGVAGAGGALRLFERFPVASIPLEMREPPVAALLILASGCYAEWSAGRCPAPA